MWSSSAEEGLIDDLTAQRDEAREWARDLWERLPSAEKAWIRTDEDMPEVPGWIEICEEQPEPALGEAGDG